MHESHRNTRVSGGCSIQRSWASEASAIAIQSDRRQSRPESRTLENAPEAPKLSSDWSKLLVEHHGAITTDRVRIHVFRLRPGDDLLGSIRAYVKQNHIQAAVLLSSVGSLAQASIRYANQPEAHIHTGHFEIVSITERWRKVASMFTFRLRLARAR